MRAIILAVGERERKETQGERKEEDEKKNNNNNDEKKKTRRASADNLHRRCEEGRERDNL